METMKIDSHQHFFKPDRIHYFWMSEDMPIAKDFLPGDLEPILKQNGIDKTILVQAADIDENEFLFELAEQTDFIAGVVIWLDMEGTDFKKQLLHYKEYPKFRGIRPLIEFIDDDAWILRPRVKDSFAVLEEHDVCFDFLSHTQHLPHVLTILNEFPKLRAVIDHISKPEIKNGVFQPWADLMTEVSSHENVYCKLSGMITEADHQTWKPDELTKYIHHILNIFGPSRCMYGSDWPVCLLAGTYEEVLNALKVNLPSLSDIDLEGIFGGNAQRFYKV